MKPIAALKGGTSAVIYGPSGTGKTTLGATAPKKLLYLDIQDNGTDSIADVKGIDVLQVSEFSEFEDAYWWLTRHKDAYKSVILDTCTQLQTLTIAELGRKKKRKGKFAHKELGDFGTMTRGDWGDVGALLKEWITNYRDLTQLGINVVFIAQHRTFNLSDEEERNDEMLAPEVGPALMPSVAAHLNASCNIVGNTFIRERTKGEKKEKKRIIEYCFGIGPSAIYRRKVRKPKSVKLPDVIVDPDWEDIVEIIKGAA